MSSESKNTFLEVKITAIPFDLYTNMDVKQNILKRLMTECVCVRYVCLFTATELWQKARCVIPRGQGSV